MIILPKYTDIKLRPSPPFFFNIFNITGSLYKHANIVIAYPNAYIMIIMLITLIILIIITLVIATFKQITSRKSTKNSVLVHD